MKAQVLLPKIFNFPFTYNLNKLKVKIGDLVEVPFGKKTELGVVWKSNYNEPKNINYKNIIKKTGYSIDEKLVNYIEWFSIYNLFIITNRFSNRKTWNTICTIFLKNYS